MYPDNYKNPKLSAFIQSEIEFNPVPYADVKKSIKESFADRFMRYGDTRDISDLILNEIAEQPHIVFYPLCEYMRTGEKEYCFDLGQSLSALSYKACDSIIEDIYNELYQEYQAYKSQLSDDNYEHPDNTVVMLNDKAKGDVFKVHV